ncbi:MAG: Arc family DNA-binding protein [Anaerolineales bacterium]|nr:Arc family DNA-binding protein [Anaerolineales bacterium]
MPTLHVRNVPEELYSRVKKSAEVRHRSLSAEVIALLESAIEGAERNTEATLSSIRRRRTFNPVAAGAPNSTDLLREDRSR